MTTLNDLLLALTEQSAVPVQIALPTGDIVPLNFHVTEVGRLQKDFIDCGGTVRSTSTCIIQVWIANDHDHRLDSAKLGKIFGLAAPILKSNDLPVEIEYESESGTVSQYPLQAIERRSTGMLLSLGTKHTACLAPQLCGVPEERNCCANSNCC